MRNGEIRSQISHHRRGKVTYILRNTFILMWISGCPDFIRISTWSKNSHTHTHLLHQGRTHIFLHTLLLRADHQYLNDQHLAWEVLTRMHMILTRSWLLFIYKMIQEIISMPRADWSYLIILSSIPGFSRMTSSNLRLKPTVDLECVCSWSKVHT